MIMLCGFDTETCLITEAEPIPQIVCASFAFPGQAGLVTREGLETIQELIKIPDLDFIGVNIAYDWQVMVRAGLPIEDVFALYEAGRVRDAGIDWFLDDIANGRSTKHSYSLAAAASFWLGELVEKEDTWRLRYGELLSTSLSDWPEEAITYARRDAEISRDLAKIPESPDSRRQAAWAWWLALAGTQGIATDPARVESLRRSTILSCGELVEKLPSEWIRVNRKGEVSKAEKTIRAYVEAHYPEHPRTDPTETNPRGQISLNYEDLVDTDDPALISFAEFKSKLSILDSDMTYLSRPRVRTKYWMAETGRTTSSGGKNSLDCYTNLQNIKTDAGIRECLIPDPGHVLLDADYEGLELCTIAQACLTLLGRSTMATLLKEGKDLHCVLAALKLHIPYEEAERRKKDKADKEFYNARQFGKIGNFGLAGGAGAAALRRYARTAYGVRISLEEAEEIKALWNRAYPEMRDYLWLGNESEVTQLFVGRKRSRCSYTVSNNTKFQGLGGDITKAAGFQIAKACYVDTASPLYGARIAVFVHDQFLLSCPEDRAEEGAAELARLMTTGMPAALCPDVPLRTEPVICRRWSKAAEPVIVGGRVIPWDDYMRKIEGRWIDTRSGRWIDTRSEDS